MTEHAVETPDVRHANVAANRQFSRAPHDGLRQNHKPLARKTVRHPRPPDASRAGTLAVTGPGG
ncbi:hypothetical protein AW736_17310 [Termitidicoccus mucosus]|uniref:Uncharacterized protein n=1 Tax=Termitidicoccus mucosus TaxID=1184151 RepID=A0A178IFJ1_9BACT|nr:hypothetical protein AW736_17310 [Opitutaceae bacterium TSB47]